MAKIIIKKLPIDEELLVSLLRQEFISGGLIGSTNLCFSHRNKGVFNLTVKGFHKAIKFINS